MDDQTKQKMLSTPADFLRHAEALIKFETERKAQPAVVASLASLAPEPDEASDAAPAKEGNVVRAFPVRKKDTPS